VTDYHIEIKLEETYLDKVNGTLTVEMYKHWSDKWGNYERLLASIPSVPWYQARAMANAVNSAKPEIAGSNVLKLRLV
jgi:hypothetical protein